MQKLPDRRARPRTAASLAIAAAVAAIATLPAPAARAIDRMVSTTQDLRDAIIDMNNSPSGPHSITFLNDITLDQVLTPIASNIAFVGGGFTVSGADTYQVFFVDSGATVAFNDLTIADGSSQGGDGAGRGGGGLGAGGALFVNEGAAVTLTDVTFQDNTAQGGDGGLDAGENVGGGGGGFHGDGALQGGGGGYNGDGGINVGGGGGLEGNGDSGDLGGNGGGEFLDGDGGTGGGVLQAGGAGGDFEGGGGGTSGGAGGYFGGGGGSNGIGRGGNGGDFGGGGGSANIAMGTVGNAGGNGGFGGGGGGGSNRTRSTGGFGGGDGTATGPGGAGSSLGGAIFVRDGGTLVINVTQTGDVTSGNRVVAATVGSGAPAVEGDDLYLMENTTVDLNVAAATTASITGSIAGDGGLVKSGTGTLVLEGRNSYAGDTQVDAGTLQGDTRALQGDIDVALGATVTFDEPSSGTYAGVLDGEGMLRKTGTGTVTLTGTNPRSGATFVDQGTLRVDTDALSGAAPTAIAAAGTLEFDQRTDGVFPGALTGAGALRKIGGGELQLTAASTFTGATTVAAGTLDLPAGASLGGTLGVSSGARLEGGGSAGAVSVQGTIAPGDGGFETLSVSQLDMGSGATLVVSANAAGQNTAVVATNTATVDGTLDLRLASGTYANQSFDIVTGAGGLTDLGLVIPTSFCFFQITTVASATTLTLQLSPTNSGIVNCANTPNQIAVANVIDANPTAPPLDQIVTSLNTLQTSQVGPALDDLSGEGLGSFTTARLAAGSQLVNAVSQRMRDPGDPSGDAGYPLSFDGFDGGTLLPGLGARASAFGGSLFETARRPSFDEREHSPFTFVSLRGDSGLGGWLDGYAIFAGVDGSANTHANDFNLYGTTGGVDYAFTDHFVAGAAAGYTRSKDSVSGLGTFGDANIWQGSLYGTFSTDDFYVGALLRYAYSDMHMTRRVAIGQLYEKPKSSFTGYEYGGYVEGGWAALPVGSAKLQPMASAFYTYLTQGSFSEKNAPTTGLIVDRSDTNSIVSSLGVRLYQHYAMDEGTDVIPELRARWAHEFGDTNRDVAARFRTVGVPSSFKVKGAEAGRDVAIVGAGWTVLGDQGSTLGLSYDATLNTDYVAHALTLQLLLLF